MATENVQDVQGRRQDTSHAGRDAVAGEEFAQRDQQRGTWLEAREDNREERRGRSGGGNGDANGAGQRVPAESIAEVALRGSALMFDLQLDAVRRLWQMQAHTAALFGAPDVAGLFGAGDERARRVFSSLADQYANSVRQTTTTMTAIGQEIVRVTEQGTIVIAEQLQQQIEAADRQTEEGLRAIREVSTGTLSQVREFAAESSEATRGGHFESEVPRDAQRRVGETNKRNAERRSVPRKHAHG